MDDLIPVAKLRDYLAGKTCKGFKPGVAYFSTGDFIACLWKDTLSYGEQISPELVILRDMETGEVVGCKVYGARWMTTASLETRWHEYLSERMFGAEDEWEKACQQRATVRGWAFLGWLLFLTTLAIILFVLR